MLTLTSILFVVIASTAAQDRCDAGWSEIGDKCLKVESTFIEDYFDALSKCDDQNDAIPAEINSQVEYDFLVPLLNNAYTDIEYGASLGWMQDTLLYFEWDDSEDMLGFEPTWNTTVSPGDFSNKGALCPILDPETWAWEMSVCSKLPENIDILLVCQSPAN